MSEMGLDKRKRRLRGADLLHNPALNKGSAFSDSERDALGIRGLLPPRVFTEEEQILRVMTNYRRKSSDLERYIFLISLQDRNETLFYRVLQENLEEMMPIIYTPTVGEACREFAHIFRRPRGLFVCANDRGRVDRILANWPEEDVRVIVVTDGERILGLGDLGANGMGIPIGKLSLYTACAGVHPNQCMPVMLDVGTNNGELLADPLYMGLKQHRLRGEAYDSLVDEFIDAVQSRFPNALVQFEDFGNRNAFRFLRKYRDRICTFNDDIQGTAAVALAGLRSALRITGGHLEDQVLLFFGAGEAGIGIADLIVSAMETEGMASDDARRRCHFMDSKGLVVKSRTDLEEHKLRYAHDALFIHGLIDAVEALRPTMLVGVSGQPQTFTEPVVRRMAAINARPIIFALSNPTSKVECTAEQAYQWTDGAAIYASGSPFRPVVYKDRTYVPGQGNNSYIFPGVGLGVTASGARHVPDSMFMAAANALARRVDQTSLDAGCVYPPLTQMRETSLAIAAAVARIAFECGLATQPAPDDIEAFVRAQMYQPVYLTNE